MHVEEISGRRIDDVEMLWFVNRMWGIRRGSTENIITKEKEGKETDVRWKESEVREKEGQGGKKGRRERGRREGGREGGKRGWKGGREEGRNR